jgi:Pentapeptide repeats (8 copies)
MDCRVEVDVRRSAACVFGAVDPGIRRGLVGRSADRYRGNVSGLLNASDPPPRRHPLTVRGFDLVEVILLVLAVLASVAALALLLSSNEAAGATMLVGVLVAVGLFRTIQITRQGQITERFTRAIELLGSEKQDVRVGAIYALERIAWDSREDHAQIMEVLTAFARERAPWPPKPSGETQTTEVTQTRAGLHRSKEPDTDVQAVVAVLGRRDADRTPYRLDLSFTDFEAGKFAKGNHGNFQKAILRGTRLKRAELRGTLLGGANFEGADLQKAHLEGAQLEAAENLEKADLHGAFYDLPSADGEYSGTCWPSGYNPRDHGAQPTGSDGETREAATAGAG